MKISKQISFHTLKTIHHILSTLTKTVRAILVIVCRPLVAVLKFGHYHIAHRPHQHLMSRWQWYNLWHSWYIHKKVHSAALGAYLLTIGFMLLTSYVQTFAADLADNWDFTDVSPYTLSSGLETSGSSVRLKAQNYTTDANTSALYHLDEDTGTSLTDSSANSNTASAANTPTWITGNLNAGLQLNGTSQNASAADSASLSLSQNNTLEAWTKFDTTFGPGTHDHKQGVIEKGTYRLYYDQETGKVTYEIANASSTTWTQQAGNGLKDSWDLNGKLAVVSQVAISTTIYAGLGNAVGDAEVWKWNGSTWTQIGGDGINGSWDNQTYENVTSMTAIGTTLYAGLGTTAGDAEVWSCDTTSNCTTWAKIGGDGINNGWAVNAYEEVDSMVAISGNLYVGLGLSANDARIYRWGGSTWTWVGGFGIGAPYAAFPTGYEAVYSMATDGTSLYAGFGSTAGDADVWKLNGTTWTQIGGDALNSSWAAATFETVLAVRVVGTTLYAGIGLTAGDAEVWSCDTTSNCTTWAKIGGDTVNSSWDSSSFEGVYSFTDDGTNLYAGLGASAGDNEVWRWSGSAWLRIGGDAINSGFTNTHVSVRSMSWDGTTLFAGLLATANNAEMWSWNGSAWTRMAGGGINNSWGYYNLQNVETMNVSGDFLYAGTGNTVAGNALIWRFDGTNWQLVGGQGVNSSWAAGTYENVTSMISFGGNLYVGLGTTTNDAEVWRFNGSTWTQIGGDNLNSGWTGYQTISGMSVIDNSLYVGLGSTTNAARVYRWSGSTWTWVGGFGIGAPYNAFTTGYESILAMGDYNGRLYVAMGSTAGDSDVWVLNTTTWTQIGGDALNSSWAAATFEEIESLMPYNGELYASLGTTTGDAEVWKYNGSVWSHIGGDGVNNSWLAGQFELAETMVTYNGRLYVGLGNGAGDGEVWELDNGSWSRVGGSGINNSWAANATETVRSFSVYKGKLYAGLGDTANADAAIWSYGNNGFAQASTTTQDTNWHHIAGTYDGSTMRVYIDGTLVGQSSVSLSIPDTAQPLLIGSTYGTSESGRGQGYFTGSLDEIRISNIARSSFTTAPYVSSNQTVTLNTAVRQGGIWHWDGFTTSETANGGTLRYRLSDDGGASWKYWNAGAWTTSTDLTQVNEAAIINTNIASFPASLSGIMWQAVLQGNGTQRTTLNTVALSSTSDTTAPNTNASAITASKAFGGSALASNAWTNGASPYFSWTTGSDTESGIKGYCIYLGTDSTANPVTTKGLLQTSPIATHNRCQFITDVANLNLATPGILGTALTTSNTPYYLNVRAIDNAGNVTPASAQFQFRFDNTPPSNPGFITGPSGFINTKAATLSWPTAGGDAPSDANSGLAGLQYRIGSTTWYGDTHSGTGSSDDLLVNDGSYSTANPPDYDNLAEGVNTISFRTWDLAGNVTTSYVSAALKINTSGAPSEPQNLTASPTSNTSNVFSFSWNEPNTFVGSANTLTYCYTVNTLPNLSNCTFTDAGVHNLGAGPYATQPGTNTFYVVAKDESGNISYDSYASTTFTANTPSPGIPQNTDIVDVSIKSTSNWRLALTWEAPVNVGAGIASYKVYRSLDNSTFTFVGSSSSTTYIDAGLAQITYYYRVRACDSTNNCGADSSAVSLIPTGKFTSPAGMVSEPSVSNITTKRARISWSTDRSSDSKIAIGTSSGQYSASEIGNSDQVSAHTIDLDNLAAGTTYYYVAKWTDEDGNTATSQEFTFTTSPAPTLKEVTTQKIGLASAIVQFTTRESTKAQIYFGKTEAFGGLKNINTSLSESTYNMELTGLEDGTKYFYKISTFDNEGNEYPGNVFSFITPPRPRITNLVFQPISGEPTSTQKITWTTNVATTSTITYGKVGSNGTDEQKSELSVEHEIIIRDLEDNSEYFLIAQGRDNNGNLTISDRQQFRTALDTRPPSVSDISLESSVRSTGAEARGQVIVSWHTDEPSTSQVAYTQGTEVKTFNNKTAEDSQLTTDHIVIVSDLPTSKVYSIQPVSRDRAGNAGTGKPQSAIIGRASDSVLTIILNSLQKVFGF